MIYRQGIRCDIRELLVTRITHYQSIVHGEAELTKYRYAFLQEATGLKFVYSGVRQSFGEGEIVNLRATVKADMDRYGFIRLCRIRSIPPSSQKELSL